MSSTLPNEVIFTRYAGIHIGYTTKISCQIQDKEQAKLLLLSEALIAAIFACGPRKSMETNMKKLLLIIPVFLIVLILAAVLIVPGLVPSSVYKEKITEQISTALGRPVEINGDIKVSVLPTLQAKASDVRIENPEGFSADTAFASMGELRAKVKLAPLLSKRVEIDEFVLTKPVISLSKKANGQSNWSFAKENAAPKPGDDEGFKRDKGFGDVKAEVGAFEIVDGTISYVDAKSGTSHEATNVNLSVSLPALDAPVSAKGNLTLDGTAMDIDARIATPETFMAGGLTPFSVALKSDMATLKADGEFLQSEALALTAAFDADIPSISAAKTWIGQDIPYSDLAEAAKASGNLTFSPDGLSLENAAVKLSGSLINADYKGAFSTLSGAAFSGTLNAQSGDVPALLKALDQDIPQASLIRSASIKADLSGTPEAIAAKAVSINAEGPDVKASYTGEASLTKSPVLNGLFSAQVDNMAAVTQALDMQIDALKAVNTANVTGKISGAVSAIKITNIDAKADGADISAAFTGGFTGGDTASVTGEFNADLTSLANLSQTTGIDIPYSDIAGGLTASGAVNGPIKALKFDGLNAALKDGLLRASFSNGAAQLGDAMTLSGAMEVETDSVRALAAATGTQLPEGDAVFGPFSLSGAVSGNPSNVQFNEAKLAFDNLSGTGGFGLDLTSTTPYLTGTLNMAGLDLAPYMAKSTKQDKSGGIKPWSEEPLNLSPLRAVNADLALYTPNVLTDRLSLGESEIAVKLKNGDLTAKVPGAQLYGGTGDLSLSLNASDSIPKVGLELALKSLNAPQFLGATAGFDKLTGDTSTVISLNGAGMSQAAIMQSLSGNGNFSLSNGTVAGVDLGQFLGGIEQAFTSRTLPAGIGPGQITQFQDLLGAFSISNGVVTVKDFDLSGKGVRAEGRGTLDLGNQQIDFSLRPRLIDEAGQPKGNGLAGLGIPLRLKGGFNGVKPGLDTDLLSQIVAERAKQEAVKKVTDQVGGPLGGILGGVLGGNQSAPSPAPTEAPANDAPAEEQTPAEQAPKKKTDEEIAKDLLKGLFGGGG